MLTSVGSKALPLLRGSLCLVFVVGENFRFVVGGNFQIVVDGKIRVIGAVGDVFGTWARLEVGGQVEGEGEGVGLGVGVQTLLVLGDVDCDEHSLKLK